jgi:hypothetical protein
MMAVPRALVMTGELTPGRGADGPARCGRPSATATGPAQQVLARAGPGAAAPHDRAMDMPDRACALMAQSKRAPRRTASHRKRLDALVERGEPVPGRQCLSGDVADEVGGDGLAGTWVCWARAAARAASASAVR